MKFSDENPFEATFCFWRFTESVAADRPYKPNASTNIQLFDDCFAGPCFEELPCPVLLPLATNVEGIPSTTPLLITWRIV